MILIYVGGEKKNMHMNHSSATVLQLDLQGPIVQSVVSLTSSLRVISLTVLADSIHNILIFFAEKNVSSFCIAKATLIFFSKKFQHICISLYINFNESLTSLSLNNWAQMYTEGRTAHLVLSCCPSAILKLPSALFHPDIKSYTLVKITWKSDQN